MCALKTFKSQGEGPELTTPVPQRSGAENTDGFLFGAWAIAIRRSTEQKQGRATTKRKPTERKQNRTTPIPEQVERNKSRTITNRKLDRSKQKQNHTESKASRSNTTQDHKESKANRTKTKENHSESKANRTKTKECPWPPSKHQRVKGKGPMLTMPFPHRSGAENTDRSSFGAWAIATRRSTEPNQNKREPERNDSESDENETKSKTLVIFAHECPWPPSRHQRVKVKGPSFIMPVPLRSGAAKYGDFSRRAWAMAHRNSFDLSSFCFSFSQGGSGLDAPGPMGLRI